MCLFTNDLSLQCRHVQCNLIKTIQMQNPRIFPNIVNFNNQPAQNQQNCHVPSIDQLNSSQSINQSSFSKNSQQSIKQLNYSNNNNHIKEQHKQQIELNHQKNVPISPYPKNNFSTQIYSSQQANNYKLANCRISNLEKQVNILQNGMKNLIDTLRQQNILTQQEYQIQCNFLKQVQNLQKLLPSSQSNQNNHNN